MKKLVSWLAISVFALVLTSNAFAANVIILSCGETPLSPPFPIVIRGSSSSAIPPPVNIDTGTSCAVALAELLNAGFEIQDVQPDESQISGIVYTLFQK